MSLLLPKVYQHLSWADIYCCQIINRIQNKSFCLHNIWVCTVYMYYIYIYINTHTCMYIFQRSNTMQLRYVPNHHVCVCYTPNIHMKSSDANASKCRLKYSSKISIFIRLLYLCLVTDLPNVTELLWHFVYELFYWHSIGITGGMRYSFMFISR